MHRPLFSASHSAKLIGQQYRYPKHDADWQKAVAGKTYWVQRGVTARGEIWGTLSEAETETLADDQDGREHDDDERHGVVNVEVEGDLGTEMAETEISHGSGHHAEWEMTHVWDIRSALCGIMSLPASTCKLGRSNTGPWFTCPSRFLHRIDCMTKAHDTLLFICVIKNKGNLSAGVWRRARGNYLGFALVLYDRREMCSR